MPEIILSICIPTYNNPSGLRRTLESLVDEITPEVEVVVRDDSAGDESEGVVREFQNKFSINYVRGKKEGVDKAILFLTREAKGKYVWWFGDDVMLPGTVGKFLELVKQFPETDFVYVNSGGREGDEKAISRIKGSRFFKSGNEVIEKLGDFLGFCSATPFLRDTAVKGLASAEKYIGSAWVTLYLVMYVISRGHKFYFLDGKNFWSDEKVPNTSTWYDPFQVFAVNFYYVVNEFRGYFSDKSIRRMLAKTFGSVWKTILVYRAKEYKNGMGSDSPKIKILAKLYWSFPEFWAALPLLLLSKFGVRFLYKAYKVFFKKTRKRF